MKNPFKDNIKHPLTADIKAEFLEKCPLSADEHKDCPFAFNIKDEVNCSQLIGWFEDLRIVNLSKCFITLQNRQKLAWRNKMVKKKLGIR